jgi:sulfane dehydrogenase subunit SoxC
MTSNSEWTGVALRTILEEVGARRSAKWFLAEGGDACLMARSIPIEKAMDDALVVWAQNGEALRPEQGFPMRLLLPGWEGNTSVKWLRRLELGTRPWMTRWETATYTDPLANGTHVNSASRWMRDPSSRRRHIRTRSSVVGGRLADSHGAAEGRSRAST